MYIFYEIGLIILIWVAVYGLHLKVSKNRNYKLVHKPHSSTDMDQGLLQSCMNIVFFLSLFLSLVYYYARENLSFGGVELEFLIFGFLTLLVIHLSRVKETK